LRWRRGRGAGCALTSGEWYSPYDDTYFTDAGDAEEVRRCGAEDADVFCVALVEVVVEGAGLKVSATRESWFWITFRARTTEGHQPHDHGPS
jgi:hypothetical protein